MRLEPERFFQTGRFGVAQVGFVERVEEVHDRQHGQDPEVELPDQAALGGRVDGKGWGDDLGLSGGDAGGGGELLFILVGGVAGAGGGGAFDVEGHFDGDMGLRYFGKGRMGMWDGVLLTYFQGYSIRVTPILYLQGDIYICSCICTTA